MKVVLKHEGVAMGRHEGAAMERHTDLVLDASLPKHKNVRLISKHSQDMRKKRSSDAYKLRVR